MIENLENKIGIIRCVFLTKTIRKFVENFCSIATLEKMV